MRLLKPLSLTFIAVMLFSMPSACPVYYVYLAGYVQHPGVNFTNTELKKLNLSDVKDTNNMAIPGKEITGFYARFSRVGDVKKTHIGYDNRYTETEVISVQKAYEQMMDTILPSLNIGDSIMVTYTLHNSNKVPKSVEEDFFYRGFQQFKMHKTYVISSQAVVDLKRSPNDNGMVAYPSPAQNEVSVKFEVKEPIAGHISILNSLGQIIAEVNHENLMQPYTFNIDKEPEGNYYMRAEVDGEFFTRKFVKE